LGLITYCPFSLHSQDTSYARKTIKQLCSKQYYGRGYYRNGAKKASIFIAKEMKKTGLKTLPNRDNCFQKFNFTVNKIQNIQLSVNGLKLIPGRDYIVDAGAIGATESLNTTYIITEKTIRDSSWIYQIPKTENNNKTPTIIVIDTLNFATEIKHKSLLQYINKYFRVVVFTRKLTWTVSTHAVYWRKIEILRSSIKEIPNPFKIKFHLKSKFTDQQQQNVIAYVKGTHSPDSFIFITAHYDHLGMMGPKAMFPGANDNACGVAMMLDLARYCSKNPQKYSIAFIAFAGEEAGLIGSHFYTQNPIVQLNNIRFLMNLDLVGTGENGGTVVNASIFKKEFSLLDSINRKNELLPKLIRRGKAANSDHYFFTEAGVPSFFLYLAGPRPSYHDVDDVPQTLTLAGYNGTFQLITRFFAAFQ
jgi:hypothetical protein